jgi:hypothetical protein
MTIYGVPKKSSMVLIVLLTTLLILFAASNRAHAISNPNLALNPDQTGFPVVTASYTCGCDNVWSTVNGIYSYNESPRDRWTNYGSPNTTDWLVIDFGSAQTFNQVKLHIFDDGGGVRPPASYMIQYWNGDNWVEVTNKVNTPEIPEAALNSIIFDTVTSPKLQVVIVNQGGAYSGLVELEVMMNEALADANAASEVMMVIEQLPLQAVVTLSDKPTIVAARSAYDNLTATQQSMVTNLSKLTEAEVAIEALEVSFADIAVVSAFGHAAGNTITVKLSDALDLTYGMQAGHFQIIANGLQAAVSDAVYDPTDSSGRTIKLTLSSPVLLTETSVALSIQSGALKTSNNHLNNAVHSIPVITYKRLDLTLDNRIGVDDVVQIIRNSDLHIDLNQDGIFDREDIRGLLGQISTQLE